jgi:hypothetical protein
MGSPSYDRDVYSGSSYSSWGESSVSTAKLSSSRLDSSMLPNGKIIKSDAKTPIIIVLDVTGSNINFAKLVYDKFPMFYGELEQKGYLEDFDISMCAVGDMASSCGELDGDDYPIQISDFAKGIEIDSWIEKIVLESGGGPGKMESYELMAHYLINNTEFKSDSKPMLFFIADEKPYPKVKPAQAEKIGLPIQDAYDPFPQLNEKFGDNVYVMLNKYGGSFDEDITNAWKRSLPNQHVIRIPEEKAIVDLILGVIALQKKDIEEYAIDMRGRGQTNGRISEVSSSLKELSDITALARVEDVTTNLPVEMRLTPKGTSGKRF